MKNLKEILEGQNFLVNRKLKNRQNQYEYHPTTSEELYNIIINLLKQGETDLNCIDVSKINNMSFLFHIITEKVTVKEIDISEWDVSNVERMQLMFYKCEKFNSDLSNWNVSNVQDMHNMFNGCKNFNSDLSNWDVSNVTEMSYMFYDCETLKKNNKIPDWYINKV